MAPKRPKATIIYSPVPTTNVDQSRSQNGTKKQVRMLPRQPTRQIWKERFKQLIPFLFVFVYSAIGGVIFWHIEGSHAREEHNSIAAKNEHLKNETAFTICKQFSDDIDEKFINNDTFDAFDHVTFVLAKLQSYARDLGLPSEDVTEWTFWGSVFYSATVCTSIGYGNMAPKTRLGQTITMLYAIFGIPLVLYTLSIIGKVFCVFIWDGYSFVHRLIFGWKKGKRKKTDITDFPIWLALLFTVGWIMTCAGLFCVWDERWDYFKSIYFFFQSLTTIGFGDITPDEPRDMIFCFIFIIIGMGLVSMCWNLIQMKVEKFVGDLMTKIREKYVQSELNESLMEGEEGTDVEKEIERISSQESTWLTSLMGKQQQNSLADEWRRKARLRNKSVQTEATFVDEEVDNVPVMEDAAMQTVVPSSYFTPFRDVQTVPYKEHKRESYGRFGSSNDDFKHLLHDIAHLINDCRQTVSRDASLSSISNLASESEKS